MNAINTNALNNLEMNVPVFIETPVGTIQVIKGYDGSEAWTDSPYAPAREIGVRCSSPIAAFEHQLAVAKKYAVAEVPLSDGKVALIDAEDAERVNQWKWGAAKHKSKAVYVRRNTSLKSRKQQTIFLHRFILNAPKGMQVDHINRNPLDNRKSNLRLATNKQNSCNSTKPIGASGFRGVFVKTETTFVAKITNDYKQIFIGNFRTAEEAARAYDKRAIELHGEFATLNFPYAPAREVGVRASSPQRAFEHQLAVAVRYAPEAEPIEVETEDLLQTAFRQTYAAEILFADDERAGAKIHNAFFKAMDELESNPTIEFERGILTFVSRWSGKRRTVNVNGCHSETCDCSGAMSYHKAMYLILAAHARLAGANVVRFPAKAINRNTGKRFAPLMEAA